jgi:6-phosphogluconolactonase
VTNNDADTVSGYNIDDKTGALTPVPGSQFSTGRVPLGIAVDPLGRFAYVANSNDNTVSGYRIDAKTGVLIPVEGLPFPAGNTPLSVAVDPKASSSML